jgi:hypothetical protein
VFVTLLSFLTIASAGAEKSPTPDYRNWGPGIGVEHHGQARIPMFDVPTIWMYRVLGKWPHYFKPGGVPLPATEPAGIVYDPELERL